MMVPVFMKASPFNNRLWSKKFYSHSCVLLRRCSFSHMMYSPIIHLTFYVYAFITWKMLFTEFREIPPKNVFAFEGSPIRSKRSNLFSRTPAWKRSYVVSNEKEFKLEFAQIFFRRITGLSSRKLFLAVRKDVANGAKDLKESSWNERRGPTGFPGSAEYSTLFTSFKRHFQVWRRRYRNVNFLKSTHLLQPLRRTRKSFMVWYGNMVATLHLQYILRFN